MGRLTTRHIGPWRRPENRRNWTALVTLAGPLFVAAVTLAACGGSGPPDGAADATASPGTVAGEARAGPLRSCGRPYSDDSAWNTPIGEPTYHPDSATFVRRIEAPLTSDPTQFTYPVYEISGATPARKVTVEGWFSNVLANGTRLENQRAGSVDIPIPAGAEPADGFDAQIIMVDPETGDEWGASVLSENPDGTFEAWNTYRYNTAWDALTPVDDEGKPMWARGAGVPYLAGLVRPCEIEQGFIEHALALSYDSPRNAFVAPATKSDGGSESPLDLPEGARLQLNPDLTELEIRSWDCTGACFTVARALQDYGMIVVDNAGRSKLYFEFEGTANWDGTVDQDMVSPIPTGHLLVLDFGQPTLED